MYLQQDYDYYLLIQNYSLAKKYNTKLLVGTETIAFWDIRCEVILEKYTFEQKLSIMTHIT